MYIRIKYITDTFQPRRLPQRLFRRRPRCRRPTRPWPLPRSWPPSVDVETLADSSTGGEPAAAGVLASVCSELVAGDAATLSPSGVPVETESGTVSPRPGTDSY